MNQKNIIISDQNLSHSPGLQMLVPEHTRSQYAELARQHLGPTQEKNTSWARYPKERTECQGRQVSKSSRYVTNGYFNHYLRETYPFPSSVCVARESRGALLSAEHRAAEQKHRPTPGVHRGGKRRFPDCNQSVQVLLCLTLLVCFSKESAALSSESYV